MRKKKLSNIRAAKKFLNHSLENRKEKLNNTTKYMKRNGRRAEMAPLSNVLQATAKERFVYRCVNTMRIKPPKCYT